jgi:hypothetical protein
VFLPCTFNSQDGNFNPLIKKEVNNQCYKIISNIRRLRTYLLLFLIILSLLGGSISTKTIKSSSLSINRYNESLRKNSISPSCFQRELAVETRAVWLNHYAFDNPEGRNETLRKIFSANFNTAFIIAPPIDGNNGWSNPSNFKAMITALTEQGVSVHIWIANLYRVQGELADFRLVAEQNAQRDWSLALLAEYPKVDGIHFDYIRYQEADIVSSEKMLGIFKTFSVTKKAISEQYPNKYLTCAGFPLSGAIATEEDEIPTWYTEWFNDLENDPVNRWKTEPYLWKGIPLPFRVQQDPVRWLNGSVLDFHVSMEYDYSTSWWCNEVDIWQTFLGDLINKVFMGLGWYSGVWDEEGITPEKTAEEIVNKINYGREHQIEGFSLFELGEPGNNDSIIIDALAGDENAPFWEETQSIFSYELEMKEKLFRRYLIITSISVGTAAIVVLSVAFLIKKRKQKKHSIME